MNVRCNPFLTIVPHSTHERSRVRSLAVERRVPKVESRIFLLETLQEKPALHRLLGHRVNALHHPTTASLVAAISARRAPPPLVSPEHALPRLTAERLREDDRYNSAVVEIPARLLNLDLVERRLVDEIPVRSPQAHPETSWLDVDDDEARGALARELLDGGVDADRDIVECLLPLVDPPAAVGEDVPVLYCGMGCRAAADAVRCRLIIVLLLLPADTAGLGLGRLGRRLRVGLALVVRVRVDVIELRVVQLAHGPSHTPLLDQSKTEG
mmetsp:Transcript_7189/g.16692  ORF Transcript_7189/g.16692 Transcript_7189/m.16692 type:complete len:269 (+) Transcript_7189:220-1026(+)